MTDDKPAPATVEIYNVDDKTRQFKTCISRRLELKCKSTFYRKKRIKRQQF